MQYKRKTKKNNFSEKNLKGTVGQRNEGRKTIAFRNDSII